jgi:hypothetical protein
VGEGSLVPHLSLAAQDPQPHLEFLPLPRGRALLLAVALLRVPRRLKTCTSGKPYDVDHVAYGIATLGVRTERWIMPGIEQGQGSKALMSASSGLGTSGS